MAVSKRLRYEILRRDGHACRYCGAEAPSAKLTVDHVIPQALGGSDDPSNLVAACIDCNAGKSSAAPDSVTVADVSQRALRWRDALIQAADERIAEYDRRYDIETAFLKLWNDWTWTDRHGNRRTVELDNEWRETIHRFMSGGLTFEDLDDLVDIAMRSKSRDTWRYFCGCCLEPDEGGARTCLGDRGRGGLSMANRMGVLVEPIWRDKDWRALSRTAQATYAQLLSQKELDRAGVLPMQPQKWVKGCNSMTSEDLNADLDELHRARFIVVDWDSDELLIRSYIRHNNIGRMPNMLKAALRSAKAVASPTIRAALAVELRRLGKADAAAVADHLAADSNGDAEPIANPSGTHPEPIANPSGGVEPFAKGSRTPGVGVGVELRTKSPSSDASNDQSCSSFSREASSEFADGTPIPPEPSDHDDGRHLVVVTPDTIDATPAPKRGRPSDAALTLVRASVPRTVGRQVVEQLAHEVDKLRRDRDVDAADIATALAEWASRSGVGPKILPHLVADAAKARTTPARRETSAMNRGREYIDVGERLAQQLEAQQDAARKAIE